MIVLIEKYKMPKITKDHGHVQGSMPNKPRKSTSNTSLVAQVYNKVFLMSRMSSWL